MPDWAEIRRNLYGAWRLAQGDRAGMSWFDISSTGFFRSFGVWIFVIPAQIVLILAIADTSQTGALHRAAVETLLVLVAWLLYAATIGLLLRQSGRGQGFAGFMIAYNWAQVLLTLALLPLILLLALGGLHTGLAALAYWLLQLVIIVYVGVIARAATGAGIALCLAIAILDQILFRLVFATGHDLLLAG